MVYKKIGNKIPSLPGLLLTGVLLAGGCPRKDKGGKGDDEYKEDTQIDVNKNVNVTPAKAILDLDLREADMQVREVLVDVLGLRYLQTNPQLIPVLTPSDLDRDSKDMWPVLQTLLGGFSGDSLKAYPQDLVKDLGALFMLKGKKDKQGNKIKYSVALAKAIAPLATFCKDLHILMDDMWKCIKDGGGADALAALKEASLCPLLSQVGDEGSNFHPAADFSNVSRSGLLTGSQLVRFLTDTDHQGNQKGNGNGTNYGVSDILNQSHTLFIKNKISTKGCKEATDKDLKPLGKRGSGMSNLKSADGKAVMPVIHKIENGRLTHRFDRAALIKLCNGSDPKVTESSHVIYASQQFGSDAVVLSDYHVSGSNDLSKLTFGTLLFTLFLKTNPKSEYDFLSLKKNEKGSGHVLVVGDSDNFNKWIYKEPQQFADMLRTHIQNNSDLQEIFCIPDLKKLYNEIFPSSLDNINHNDLANEGGSAASGSFVPKTGNALDIVCKAVLGKLRIYTKNDGISLFSCIKQIALLYQDRESNGLSTSDVTLEELFYMGVAYTLYSNKEKFVISVGQAGGARPCTKGQFVELIKTFLRTESNKAIIRVGESGGYESTGVTDFVRMALENIGAALARKSSDASYTYAKIAEMVGHEFDVENVREVYQAECKKIGDLLGTDTVSVLLKSGPITLDDFSYIPGLTDTYIKQLNSIKDAYWSKKKEIKVKAPALAG